MLYNLKPVSSAWNGIHIALQLILPCDRKCEFINLPYCCFNYAASELINKR